MQKREKDFTIARLKTFQGKLTNVIASFMMHKEIVKFDMIPRLTLSKKRVRYRLLLYTILGILVFRHLPRLDSKHLTGFRYLIYSKEV